MPNSRVNSAQSRFHHASYNIGLRPVVKKAVEVNQTVRLPITRLPVRPTNDVRPWPVVMEAVEVNQTVSPPSCEATSYLPV
jgi:hypothetical protein